MDAPSALERIAADAARGDIVFPTHTDIALRVQRQLDDPDCSSESLVKLLAAEPLLSARVLSLANSTAYNPGGRSIADLKNAIARIGYAALRALTASIVVRQMQGMSGNPAHRAIAARLWEHTTHVASLARLLARRVTRQNPDAAFFAGIVHEVGSFYLISRAAAYPGLLEGDHTLEAWCGDGEALVGRAVLKALDAPASVADAMEVLWGGYLAMPPSSLGDTLLLANELAPVESPLDALESMSRKGMPVELELLINDETLTSILAESADEVQSLRQALA
ncbi:HDOD domain-containing protein [Propionivibrio dicarboxylicus]|uniref:HD-like signal output (HDOD) domain, no enzymatic activity n=1 Tax=Propionivibrio dicarboxylicus TaxID=83767 RepID=A0A1G8KQ02_9RHOO|nr:HDOD domain-containing protein [Propionivibrio dicarboxylicus]SDI45508.1 HD-like signal output (HDOD) domain, no enzymatic activity [Propionivibrio dicarboxylicus]